MTPQHFLNTPGGARIPVFSSDSDWAAVGIHVMQTYRTGRQLFLETGPIWLDDRGHAVAIVGDPGPAIMDLIRNDRPLKA